ncbi:MAG: class I SAM-dependent methyltransferase [Eubacteriaceae bacterium]|nr:class I SAM-dependent methyltransferase [Eubacteriaceae bacterium]
MGKRLSPDEKLINDYLEEIDLKPSPDHRRFWEDLYLKYGNIVGNRLIEIFSLRSEEANNQDIYEVKNETLALSLDFAKYSADLYRRYFEWFIKRTKRSYRLILDIGCDNGIVTCFLAILFPDAEIMGIDIGENGIKCARQLAKRLNLTNITFYKIDWLQIKEHFPNCQFDLINSLRSFHEISDFPDEKYWSLNDLAGSDRNQENQEAYRLVSELLAEEESDFFACERLTTAGEVVSWIERLKQTGLYVKWEECDRLAFHEVGDVQEMPILVFHKIDSGIDTVQGVSEMYVRNEMIDTERKKEYLGESAEYVFTQLSDKEFIQGWQINFADESGKLRIEFWKQKNQLIFYEYSNLGDRELKMSPLDRLDASVKELSKKISCYASTGNDVLKYDRITSGDESDRNQ